MKALSTVCKMFGHRFRDTYVILDDGDFVEVEDARYCQHCGKVHANLEAN